MNNTNRLKQKNNRKQESSSHAIHKRFFGEERAFYTRKSSPVHVFSVWQKKTAQTHKLWWKKELACTRKNAR